MSEQNEEERRLTRKAHNIERHKQDPRRTKNRRGKHAIKHDNAKKGSFVQQALKHMKQHREKYFVAVASLVLIFGSAIFFVRYFSPETDPTNTIAPTVEQQVAGEQSSESPQPPEHPTSNLTPTPANENHSEEMSDYHSEVLELNQQRPPDRDRIYRINTTESVLTSILDAYARSYRCAAASLVYFDGATREFYTYQYGHSDIANKRLVTANTMFCVASLSKYITAICAMTLVDEEKLDLDKDISDYLGYEVRNPRFPDDKITTRMLMMHTSSILEPAQYWYSTNRASTDVTQDLLESRRTFVNSKPGEEFNYSALLGYAVIGLICENITGQRFDTFAREVLFEPMGIDAAFLPSNLENKNNIAILYQENHRRMITVEEQLNTGDPDERTTDQDRLAANLIITPIDYARILVMMGNRGTYGDVRILSEKSADEMQVVINLDRPYKHGLGTRYQDNRDLPFFGSYWHLGSAWGSKTQYNYFNEENSNRGIVVFTTGSNSSAMENAMLYVCTDLSLLTSLVYMSSHALSSNTTRQ